MDNLMILVLRTHILFFYLATAIGRRLSCRRNIPQTPKGSEMGHSLPRYTRSRSQGTSQPVR